MVEVARSRFTFLSQCAPEARIVLGDARISLRDRTPANSLDILAVDAFTSDAVPMHLLTREALAEYGQAVQRDGIVLFHISNRYVDLQRVLGNLARDAGLVCRARDELHLDPRERAEGKSPSQWVAVMHRHEHFGQLKWSAYWLPPEVRPDEPVWTDAFTNLLGAFKWD